MIKVAIVEDNKTTREGLKRIVNLAPGYQCVCTCSTGEEALHTVVQHAPEIALMDIQLPGISGIECVAALKESLPDTQFLMLTVYEDPDRIFSALRAGATAYLLKRSTPDQLFGAIREVLDGGAPMSGAIARKVVSYFRAQQSTDTEVENLSRRESEVLELIVHGFSNKEIAGRLSISVETLRWHLHQIYRKLHVHSRTEAALKFRPRA
jgi:DNA-binding NarL/FixJ family response regulator